MGISEKNKSQVDKFKEAARELETSDSEEEFDAKLKYIVKTPPPKEKPKGGGENG